jgi:hypothetical protein
MIEEKNADKKKREDLKTVALGTSKINYLDPRITVAWCKTHEVHPNHTEVMLFEGLPTPFYCELSTCLLLSCHALLQIQ